MKTAALVPTPGDPFLVRHWLVNCERVWREEVDEVRVLVTGQPNAAARKYIREHVEAVGGTYTERVTGGLVTHGNALNILITDTDADVVVLLEDDVRVRSSGELKRCLDLIREDEVDVVGSPRVSMTPNLQHAAHERWGGGRLIDYSEGHGMWPAFVFARRECLLSTDRDYGERAWGHGMVVPGLRYKVEEDTAVSDTFGGTAFQLRDRYRVRDVPQWKGPWHWGWWLNSNKPMGWFHIGSLSSSYNLAGEELPDFSDGRTLTDGQELGEWAHRLHWWRRCLRLHGRELPEHAERYQRHFERLRQRMGVRHELIDGWDEIIHRMVTWDEAV